MHYASSCSDGYACSGGNGGYAGNSGGGATLSVSSTGLRSVRMIGCTCGGRSACRGTCRTPA